MMPFYIKHRIATHSVSALVAIVVLGLWIFIPPKASHHAWVWIMILSAAIIFHIVAIIDFVVSSRVERLGEICDCGENDPS